LHIGGVLLFLLGIAASVGRNSDEEQGKKINFFRTTFFFLPMLLWGLIAIAGGIFLLAK
jgi:hypothetical protein